MVGVDALTGSALDGLAKGSDPHQFPGKVGSIIRSVYAIQRMQLEAAALAEKNAQVRSILAARGIHLDPNSASRLLLNDRVDVVDQWIVKAQVVDNAADIFKKDD